MALKLLKKKSLLAIVENSVKGGDNYLFRNFYAINNGQEVDILEDGKNSCAAFVSWILIALELIKMPHATVEGTVRDLLQSGWHEINELKPGAVLLWEKAVGKYDGLLHSHIGFYVGDNEAVSNGSQGEGVPWKHHITYGGTRKIEKIYWHPELN
ncbi:MAG: hypothetical protein A3I26_01405 [Candidatus Yanofskybacteria bacterium RIFCSPLOWO2_02_FULL_43_10]|uniref:NlpC/P60 domain-containing protein n=1 Tax=Candidatus Yanofskybacteria bacterium RIFCSPLOWO2_12_FULL_43_11b TaxID=1802710 RepID=A0A1F8H6W8_9BACT|nr:MAG: hypothetical protein A2742_02685 [Candidatus Yanofskybacteria bacterium RIFCSPHIGHO2_01_FULL_43_32]OGN10556.1 MAG: hypothetical protein A3C69_02295 [Candidatus Yanofskybacteria bacterium RIFCSPHIGHO2_02_FULL_43_12]OGN24452.1 MAG: hypothetical protein A2923_00025 [Candidatus Yanofskybacteria bacterium RIFCSPLOWO2_01_FULL_43_46]OGN28424.1 MAG: hypothetical protein A3I26_01405 [Candidatus Yanofskybacteria bacterium RIFCSPLOWO2_02_FULL_43_10]OGN33343.1 MAG: hypothetical protein A3G51_03230 